MRYALLIYTSEAVESQMSQQERDEMYAAYGAFGPRFKEQLLGGEALLPTTSATTVRTRDGKTLTTDGPFAETKEQLGGFYLVNCGNLDEAIQIATEIPGAAYGTIEVRPIMEFD